MIQQFFCLLMLLHVYMLWGNDKQQASLAACEQQYSATSAAEKSFCWLEIAVQQCYRGDEQACALLERVLKKYVHVLGNKTDQCSYETQMLRIARWTWLRHKALKLGDPATTSALQTACEKQLDAFHPIAKSFCWLNMVLQRCQEHDKQACDFLQSIFDEHMASLCHQIEMCRNRVGCSLLTHAFGVWLAEQKSNEKDPG